MNTRTALRRSVLTVAIAAAAGSVIAQEATPIVESTPAWRLQQQAQSNAEKADGIRMGEAYSARHLMDADVRGSDGRKVGDVDNFIVGADGRIEGIVVSSSGFLGIGKTRFVVPWQQAKLEGSELKSVQVPVAKDAVARFSPFDDDQLTLPANSHRGSELVGDWISLQSGQLLGRVDDLLFDRDGHMQYVVVSGDGPQGQQTYAYPYRAQSADAAYVGMPYERPTRGDLMPFDYAQLTQASRMAAAQR